MSQKYPLLKGTSHHDSIFTPGIKQNSKKMPFIPDNIFFGPKLYPLHLPGFQAKQKIHMFNFSRYLISKTTAATPLVN